MIGLFDEIKKAASLLTYIDRFTDAAIQKIGEKTYRANPCPLCAHHDCFTIYDDNQTFHCFSCGKTGDTVHLEKFMAGLGSNLEAARALKEKYAAIDDWGDHRHMNTGQVDTPLKVKELMEQPDQPDQRLVRLRNLTAAYFHERLLRDQAALDYMVKDRKHSLDVIKRFQIGIAGGNLIAYATAQGYAVSDLEAIGLVKKNKRGYSNTIPSGLYVYPHKKEGDVLFFSIKDPSKKHKWQVKKQFAAKGWLCMNQDALKNTSIIVVEGEDDLLSVFDKAKQSNVIATIGNYNTKNILDYVRTHSKGKTFYLSFDNDEAGRIYTKKYSTAIIEGGGMPYVISL